MLLGFIGLSFWTVKDFRLTLGRRVQVASQCQAYERVSVVGGGGGGGGGLSM